MSVFTPILEAELDTFVHPPVAGIQWWEYEKGEGPLWAKENNIPGLLPTYGAPNGISFHELVEEYPAHSSSIVISRKKPNSHKPWTLEEFVQMQYGIYKQDNKNREKVYEALQNRAAIVTEGDTYVRIIGSTGEQANINNMPNTDPVDTLNELYGHWVQQYSTPTFAMSECELRMCRKPETVWRLVHKQAMYEHRQMRQQLKHYIADPLEVRWSGGGFVSDPSLCEGVGYPCPNLFSGALIGPGASVEAAFAIANSIAAAEASKYMAWYNANNVNSYAEFLDPNSQVTTNTIGPIEVTSSYSSYALGEGFYGTPRVFSMAKSYTLVIRNTEDHVEINQVGFDAIAMIWSYVTYPNFPTAEGQRWTPRPDLYPQIYTEAVLADITPYYTDSLALEAPQSAAFTPPNGLQLTKMRGSPGIKIVALKTPEAGEIPFECESTFQYPYYGASPCSGAEELPINDEDGSMCDRLWDPSGLGEAIPEIPWEQIYPPGSITYPGGTFLLKDGSEEPLYPTFFGAYVYDVHLKKWGRFDGTYLQLVDYQPINQATNGVQSYAKFGILGGVLDESGNVRLFDQKPVRSKITYGKIGYTRQGMTSVEEARVHFRVPCTGHISVETSVEGRLSDPLLTQTRLYQEEVAVQLNGGFSGRWHNIVLEGQFDISYMEFRGIIQGKR